MKPEERAENIYDRLVGQATNGGFGGRETYADCTQYVIQHIREAVTGEREAFSKWIREHSLIAHPEHHSASCAIGWHRAMETCLKFVRKRGSDET